MFTVIIFVALSLVIYYVFQKKHPELCKHFVVEVVIVIATGVSIGGVTSAFLGSALPKEEIVTSNTLLVSMNDEDSSKDSFLALRHSIEGAQYYQYGSKQKDGGMKLWEISPVNKKVTIYETNSVNPSLKIMKMEVEEKYKNWVSDFFYRKSNIYKFYIPEGTFRDIIKT